MTKAAFPVCRPPAVRGPANGARTGTRVRARLPAASRDGSRSDAQRTADGPRPQRLCRAEVDGPVPEPRVRARAAADAERPRCGFGRNSKTLTGRKSVKTDLYPANGQTSCLRSLYLDRGSKRRSACGTSQVRSQGPWRATVNRGREMEVWRWKIDAAPDSQLQSANFYRLSPISSVRRSVVL